MKAYLAAAAIALSSISVASAADGPSLTPAQKKTIDKIIARASADETAYDFLEGLTTEVGQRLPGSAAEARAREWGAAKFRALDFKNVRVETYPMPAWSRLSEEAAIVSPFPQALRVTALGLSAASPEGGVTAEVVRFATLNDLKRAAPGSLNGKIVFVDEKLMRTQDGSGYGFIVQNRSAAAVEGARRGAVAALIRSVGTDSHRNPHTGAMRYEDGVKQIPIGALSNPDADQLTRAINHAKGPVTVSLNLQTATKPDARTGNVIGEIKGKSDCVILIGGHLDSWDLGTGAIDDAAGIAITTGAAKVLEKVIGKPQCTIRVVMWGAEEVGSYGGNGYAVDYKDTLQKHRLAAESDFGAGRVWRVATGFGPGTEDKTKIFREALRPLSIEPSDVQAFGGADIEPVLKLGVPTIDLDQDGSKYFDLHHTPDDTLDKVDPAELKQNVAAWAVMLYVASEITGDLGRGAEPADER